MISLQTVNTQSECDLKQTSNLDRQRADRHLSTNFRNKIFFQNKFCQKQYVKSRLFFIFDINIWQSKVINSFQHSEACVKSQYKSQKLESSKTVYDVS